MATHSSIPAWKIPWTESLVGTWYHKALDSTEVTKQACIHLKIKISVISNSIFLILLKVKLYIILHCNT